MTLERIDELALLRLDDGRANAINPALLDELDRQLDALQADDARALVITGRPRFFSAGLDLPAVVPLERPAMGAFMERFERVMDRIFCLPCPVVAAVNGHAIAGGCVLAAQADLRVLVDTGARYGVNEVRLGVGVPTSVVQAFRVSVPPAAAARALTGGELFEPGDALALGLVDELAPEDQVLPRALAHASRLASVPAEAHAQAKSAWRARAQAVREAARAEGLGAWLDQWFSEPTQALLHAAVASLASKG